MVRKIAASLGFIKENVSKKTSFGTQVIEALTENAETFPNLPVPLDTLTSSNNALISAVVAAGTGEHVAVANLKTAVKAWNNNFRLTANYVSYVADGNDVTVRLSGFTPTKSEKTPTSKPGTPSKFQASANGTKGSINTSCNPVNDSKALVFTALPEGTSLSFNGDIMLITAGNLTVQVLVTTKRKAVFTNVTSGTAMDMSVFAINSAGIGTLANGQNVIAQ